MQVSYVSQPEVPRVAWTPEADSDLQLIVKDPAVREEVKRNAEMTLHDIEAFSGQDRRSEGFEGEVMWHRGWNHKQERRASWLPEQADEGPWNYVLFYRSVVGPAEFEVLAVRSRIQIAEPDLGTAAKQRFTPPVGPYQAPWPQGAPNGSPLRCSVALTPSRSILVPPTADVLPSRR